MNLAAELGKLACNKVGYAMLLETKLGVYVQVLPPGGHVAVNQIDQTRDLHGESLHDKRTNFTLRPLGEAQK